MQLLERLIFIELRLMDNRRYRRVKWKDVMEWSSREVIPHEGEYSLKLKVEGTTFYLAIKGSPPSEIGV